MMFRHRGRQPPSLPVLIKMLTGTSTKEVRDITTSVYHSEIIGVVKQRTVRWWNQFLLGPAVCAGMISQVPGRPDTFTLARQGAGEEFRMHTPSNLETWLTRLQLFFLVNRILVCAKPMQKLKPLLLSQLYRILVLHDVVGNATCGPTRLALEPLTFSRICIFAKLSLLD